jgi:hypothetical protein
MHKKSKLTTEKFIKISKKVHKNKYDYSRVAYKNEISKVIIICPIHGEFLQAPYNHKKGHGCQECVNRKKLTTEEFIKRARIIHGDKYDYSESLYESAHKKIKIICPIHGQFSQTASSHINTKCGCPKCANKKRSTSHLLNTEEFIKMAKGVHKNKYDYSKVIYKTAHKKIKILCPIHGAFFQSPNSHLSGTNCPKCSAKAMSERFTSTTENFIKKADITHHFYYDYSLVVYKSAKKV